MFGNKKSDSSNNNGGATVSAISNNLITSGTRIDGNINASFDIRIDGELYGNLICQGKLVIGAEGKIIGNIECQSAVIEGTYQGKLVCSELLNIRETAKITGEIITEKLMVQTGAIFNVTCNMNGKHTVASTNSKKEAINN
jgi:cytoskeletal protein CcmA (bactofilin family)